MKKNDWVLWPAELRLREEKRETAFWIRSAAAFVVMILLLSAYGAGYSAAGGGGGGSAAAGKRAVVTPENAGEILSGAGSRSRVKSYEVTQSAVWSFDGSTGVSRNAYVRNAVENGMKVRFELTLLEAPELVIYSSPVLSPGEELRGLTLDRIPSPGTYEGVCTYYIPGEEGKPEGSVKAGVTVNIDE